jgi:hypothetical protein
VGQKPLLRVLDGVGLNYIYLNQWLNDIFWRDRRLLIENKQAFPLLKGGNICSS